jgi:hypothetical protein
MLGDECLAEHWFVTLQEAQLMIEAWGSITMSTGRIVRSEFVERAAKIGLQEGANFQFSAV